MFPCTDTPREHGGALERAMPEYEGGVPDALRSTAITDATGAAITSGQVAPGTFFNYAPLPASVTSSARRPPTTSQPSLSAAIRRLEHELNVPIVRRGRR
jgi:hypothetical protein